jgi:serine protease inhibitor
MKALALLPLAALLLAACGPPPASIAAPNAASSSDTPSSAGAAAEALDPDPAFAEAMSLAAAVRAPVANSNNAFAASLWSALRDQPGNLAVSPASITTALAMVYGGARGETAAEMKRVLHFEGSPEEVTRSVGGLQQQWNAGNGPTILRSTNRLFGEATCTFEKPFLDATQSAFGAPLETVDFVKSPERARQHINDWMEKETQYRVRDVIPRDAVDGLTRLVLVNAIYFKADWAHPFEASATRFIPFYLTKTDRKDVPTMRKEGTFRFAERGGVRVLELPYEGQDASMVLLVTDAVDGLPALEQALTSAELDRWISAMKPELVDVTLPKFEIEPSSSISLRETLGALGMRLAFDKEKADFTGIANPKSPRDRLFLRDVFHRAFVKVDEKGTEAAAVTAVFNAYGGMPPEPRIFRADHPFLFVLRDTKTGMILFMGRVANPSDR